MYLCFSPNSKLLAWVDHDQLVPLWDLENGCEVSFLGPPLVFGWNNLTFYPDSDHLTFGAARGTVETWDTRTARRVSSFGRAGYQAGSPNGLWLATEARAHLATASAADPKDTFLSLKVAALQAWFGEDKELTKGARKPSIGILKQELDRIDEDYADDHEYDEATDDAVDTASLLFSEPSANELALLKPMRQWAEKASGQPDSKVKCLIDWLNTHIRTAKKWSDERVIIFTEYRASQNWLKEVLAQHGFTGGNRMLTMYGGMDLDEREHVKAAFQSAPEVSPVRILLATDAAAEGLNLQNHCYRLIHYEIPWNPNRLEQRDGRIDRHG